jgi:hypothetical protein
MQSALCSKEGMTRLLSIIHVPSATNLALGESYHSHGKRSVAYRYGLVQDHKGLVPTYLLDVILHLL